MDPGQFFPPGIPHPSPSPPGIQVEENWGWANKFILPALVLGKHPKRPDTAQLSPGESAFYSGRVISILSGKEKYP
jgi:hypothetical protein